MSQASTTTSATASPDDWERALAQLRADGFSPVESIKVTRAVLQVSLGEAKRIVHESQAWADRRAEFEQIHEVAASSLRTS